MKKDTKGTTAKSGSHTSETGAGPTQGSHQHFSRTAKAPAPENSGASGPATVKSKY